MLYCGHSFAWVCADGDNSGKEEDGEKEYSPCPEGTSGWQGAQSLHSSGPHPLDSGPDPHTDKEGTGSAEQGRCPGGLGDLGLSRMKEA